MNARSDGDFCERRAKTWMYGFLTAGGYRTRGFGELSTFFGEFLCHCECQVVSMVNGGKVLVKGKPARFAKNCRMCS